MTRTAPAPERTAARSRLPDRPRRHRPLLWAAALTSALAVVFAVLAVIDPAPVAGANGWFTPLKFALSIAVHTATMSWLIGLLTRRRRLASALGNLIGTGTVVMIGVVGGVAALGATSHVTTTTTTTEAGSRVFAVMGVSVVMVYAAMVLVAVLAFTGLDGVDRARRAAVRAGLLVSLVGLGLAFLMLGPVPEQGASGPGVLGAHAVGAPDGGPGLPFLGWSTVAGDLRVGHFLGLHALQAVPLLLFGLEAAARRVPVLRDAGVRARLVWVGAVAHLGFTLLLTGQALAGESVVAPSALTALMAATIAGLALAGALMSVHRRRDGVTAP